MLGKGQGELTAHTHDGQFHVDGVGNRGLYWQTS